MAGSDYGTAGRVGVLVPRENPTVEPELSVLLDPDVVMLSARMTSDGPTMNERLVDYGREIDRWMRSFGSAQLDAVAFACTGTSYLAQGAVPEAWSDPNGREIPFVSAADALEKALIALGSHRLALVSPYPADLSDLAVAYWRRRGFAVVSVTTLKPPPAGYHPIYVQSGAAVGEAIGRALGSNPEAAVALGTGAPTLAAIAARNSAVPVLSSNLCLGWAVAAALKKTNPVPIARWIAQDAPWRMRLRDRFPATICDAGSGTISRIR